MMELLDAGMNIARLNLSHGEYEWHAKTIQNLREASRRTNKRLSIIADLPGPKIRIGNLVEEPIELMRDDHITLTTEEIIGTKDRVFVSLPELPQAVKYGDVIFLNDGIVQVKVIEIHEHDVKCQVIAGGELRSHKGLNLPGIDLGICAFTEHDRECLRFAFENGIESVSQSFIDNAKDVEALREAAREMGYDPFLIAKIERAGALKNIDEIIAASDGIMVARGDLGVETRIESIAIIQKELMYRANRLAKPVIVATQMLESMVNNARPTRAESTDVANAILDGTDCIMLSEESAMGRYPVEAARMLAQIAEMTEAHRYDFKPIELSSLSNDGRLQPLPEIISQNVRQTVEHIKPEAVIVHTQTGYTARMISRFKLPVWTIAVSKSNVVSQQLMFTYGVLPVHLDELPNDWNVFARNIIKEYDLKGSKFVLTEGPSPEYPTINPRVEIIDLGEK